MVASFIIFGIRLIYIRTQIYPVHAGGNANSSSEDEKKNPSGKRHDPDKTVPRARAVAVNVRDSGL